MKSKNKLNCYLFSNLIISILTLNFFVTDNSKELVAVSNNNKLNKIYEIEEVSIQSILANSNITSVNTVSKPVQSTTPTVTYVRPSYNSVTGANLVNYAKYYLGLPYVYGGNSLTNGTDCSGFTKLIYQEFGFNLGRTVSSQIYSGTYVSKSDLQPGDLVFYGYSNYATHVGIYIGNGLVIHESNPRDGVKINTVNMMVYITARRLITADIVRSVQIPSNISQEIEKEATILEENTPSEPPETNTTSETNTLPSNTDLTESKEKPSQETNEEKLEDEVKQETDTTLTEEVK